MFPFAHKHRARSINLENGSYLINSRRIRQYVCFAPRIDRISRKIGEPQEAGTKLLLQK